MHAAAREGIAALYLFTPDRAGFSEVHVENEYLNI